MSREQRIALCLERIGKDLPNLKELVDITRLRFGEREELLVVAARIEAALRDASAETQAELALLFLAAHDWPRARRYAEEATHSATDPEVQARGHALVGRLDELAGSPADALGHYRRAATLQPASWRHQLDLAAVLVDVDDPAGWSEAGEALAAASALAGESEQIALIGAQLMIRTGEIQEARRALQGLVRDGSDRFAAMAAAILSRLGQ